MVVRLLLAIGALSLAITFIQLAIVALVITGLIFRTRETAGLFIFLGVCALVRLEPLIGLGLIAATLALAVSVARRDTRLAKAINDPDQE